MNRVNGSASLGFLFGRSADGLWGRFLEAGIVEYMVWLALLVGVAIFAIKNIRAKTVQQEPKASQLLSKFREQQSRGELSGEEFREIKTTLAAQLKAELKDNGGKG
jgi:uncharacterized membrane protein